MYETSPSLITNIKGEDDANLKTPETRFADDTLLFHAVVVLFICDGLSNVLHNPDP